jgi:hypothetical protein
MDKMFKSTKTKQIKISDPLKALYDSARSINEMFTEKRKPVELELMADVLEGILTSQVRFLTSIYVCLFLQKDYPDREMDEQVLYFMDSRYTSVNELVGLCEYLSPFLSRDGLGKVYGNDLFRVQFDNLRLKAPLLADPDDPLSAKLYKKYGQHVWQVIESFRKETEFLNQSVTEIDWEFKCYDNTEVYRTAASRLLRKKSFSRDAAHGFYQQCGACRLCLPAGQPIRLDPIVIPLKNQSRGKRLAALVKFGSFQSQERGPILYRELTADRVSFRTGDPHLFKQLYEKKGFVSEAPNFKHQTMLLDGKITVQLYEGDIFDLNFMENAPRRAMVNVLYTDLANRTLLSKRLENLAGSEIFEEIKMQGPLSKERVYVTGPGELPGHRRFQMIFHCPIYDVNEGKNPSLSTIQTAIRNILEECITQGIACLVAPAMGQFWAGQTRQVVASAWIDMIQNHSALKDSSLKRVIFSFINPETCDVYQKCLRDKTHERFETYHLPVSRIHNDIVTSHDSRLRLQRVLDLNQYLYNFIVAWCIRSLMWEIIKAEESGRSRPFNERENKFLKNIYKRAGFDATEAVQDKHTNGGNDTKRAQRLMRQIKDSAVVEKARQLRDKIHWSNNLNLGDWRSLAQQGYEAIREHEWSFNRWFSDSDKSGRKVFHQFLNPGGELTDFVNLRNKIAHPRWHTVSSSEIKEPADQAAADIQKVIEHLPFLQQEKNILALIEEFKVNEDKGVCRISYRDLSGERSTPLSKILPLPIRKLGGRLVETGRVYLIEQLPDESIRALNMHPFLLYGECPGCHSHRLFVWRDFKGKFGQKIKITYGSTGCKCDKAFDKGEIARNSHEKLNQRFEDILAKLNRGIEEPRSSSVEDQEAL